MKERKRVRVRGLSDWPLWHVKERRENGICWVRPTDPAVFLLQSFDDQLFILIYGFAAFSDFVHGHFCGPSAKWKEHWEVTVAFGSLIEDLTYGLS